LHPIFYQYEIFGQPRVIAGYGTMVALGIVFGTSMALLLARRRGLDVVNVLLVALIAVTAGLVGSYLLFIVTVLDRAIQDPSILLQGGLVFYGGPLAAIPAAWIACKRLEVDPGKVADVAAPSLALGHALGRLGCFLGGCCFGAKWDGPCAVTFSHEMSPAAALSIPRHPVQLYESGFLIIAVIVTLLVFPRVRAGGQIGLSYLLAYAVWRMGVEMIRGDVIRGYLIEGWLTTSQTVSLVLLPLGMIGLILLGRRGRGPLVTRRVAQIVGDGSSKTS